ncbi:MAG: VOC family protein [Pseudomonadales bacterium]|nr:VOC family protein [Pseudomonadales bacterium]
MKHYLHILATLGAGLRAPHSLSPGRRRLLGALPALAFAPGLLAQSPAPAIRVSKLNSFELRVSDVQRSLAFYQDLFGMPVQARYGQRLALRIGEGPQFMALRPLQTGESPAITHLGYAVENFAVEPLLTALASQGIDQIEAPEPSVPGLANAMKSWVRLRGATTELYFADARGLIVQLSDAAYCGGSGALGDGCEMLEAAPSGLMALKDINHFTAFVSDGAAANRFYQNLFGLSIQAYQGPNSPVTGIGDGYQFVMYAGPFPGGENAPVTIHHACFNMDGFDVDKILATLTAYGLTARSGTQSGPMIHYVSRRMPDRGGAEGGTPELYFTDPDGILMQLQDASYCGGGAYLGNECLAG